MLPSILIRTWRRNWFSLLLWMGFCLLMSIYNLSLYPYFTHLPEYTSFLAGLPQWILFFEGQPGQLVGDSTFFFLTTLGFTVPCVWLVLVVHIGLKETAGEEEAGSLIFLLSHPIERWELYLSKVLAIFFITSLMGLFFWGCMWGVITFAKIPLALDWLAMITLNLGLFVLWCSALAMLLGALTGKLDLSAMLVGLAALTMWLVEGFCHTAIFPVGIRWFNPWGLVLMSMVEKNTITPWVWVVMVGLCLLCFAGGIASWQFRNFSRQAE